MGKSRQNKTKEKHHLRSTNDVKLTTQTRPPPTTYTNINSMNFFPKNTFFPMARSLARPAHQAAKMNPSGMHQLELAKNDFIEQQQDLVNDQLESNATNTLNDSVVVLNSIAQLATNK